MTSFMLLTEGDIKPQYMRIKDKSLQLIVLFSHYVLVFSYGIHHQNVTNLIFLLLDVTN